MPQGPGPCDFFLEPRGFRGLPDRATAADFGRDADSDFGRDAAGRDLLAGFGFPGFRSLLAIIRSRARSRYWSARENCAVAFVIAVRLETGSLSLNEVLTVTELPQSPWTLRRIRGGCVTILGGLSDRSA